MGHGVDDDVLISLVFQVLNPGDIAFRVEGVDTIRLFAHVDDVELEVLKRVSIDVAGASFAVHHAGAAAKLSGQHQGRPGLP